MLIRLGGLGFGGALISSVIFSVPMAWLTIPVLALLRWAAERQVDARRTGEPLLRRARLPIVLVVVMLVLGSFELLPDQGRENLQRTNAFIQQGLQADVSRSPARATARSLHDHVPAGSEDGLHARMDEVRPGPLHGASAPVELRSARCGHRSFPRELPPCLRVSHAQDRRRTARATTGCLTKAPERRDQ